jgi:hypothetical protein
MALSFKCIYTSRQKKNCIFQLRTYYRLYRIQHDVIKFVSHLRQHDVIKFVGHLRQHDVIKFVSHLRQVGGFHRVLRIPPPIKLTAINSITLILYYELFNVAICHIMRETSFNVHCN